MQLAESDTTSRRRFSGPGKGGGLVVAKSAIVSKLFILHVQLIILVTFFECFNLKNLTDQPVKVPTETKTNLSKL